MCSSLQGAADTNQTGAASVDTTRGRSQTDGVLEVDWGAHQDPLHLPGLGPPDCEPVDSDDPAALPLVQAARSLGYQPAPEAPLWCFLPAIWPQDARAWVRDTRIRHQSVSCTGRPAVRVPWSAADHAEVEADITALLAKCGIPSRPAGRLWLLRPPPGYPALDAVLRRLAAAAEAADIQVMASPNLVVRVTAELQRLFDAMP
jgi:hypothetical protein